MITFVGNSGTGKTTLITKLIPVLKSRGLKVGTIKHAGHGFDMDKPGKDTFLHKQAGAYGVLIASKDTAALVKDITDDPGPKELIKRYLPEADIVLVEGYKKENLPKIEVLGFKTGNKSKFQDAPNLVALVSPDIKQKSSVPVFLHDDVEKIADFIITGIL